MIFDVDKIVKKSKILTAQHSTAQHSTAQHSTALAAPLSSCCAPGLHLPSGQLWLALTSRCAFSLRSLSALLKHRLIAPFCHALKLNTTFVMDNRRILTGKVKNGTAAAITAVNKKQRR